MKTTVSFLFLVFCFLSLSAITITGRVVGNTAPTVGLENANILIFGTNFYNVFTNASGHFTITGVVGNSTYDYYVLMGGYQESEGTISVGNVDYDWGTIILNEDYIPPTNAQAVYLDTNIQISWTAPISPTTGYKVWRLQTGQETNESAWTLLTPSNILQTNFTDAGWSTLPNGSYRWAVKAGYINNTMSLAAISNTLVKPAANTVNVIGTVAGSDAPTVGLSNTTITLTGDLTYSATTNAAGQFTITDVAANSTYTYTITHPDYSPATGTINVGSVNYSMGTIIVNELYFPPTNVQAVINGQNVDINWTDTVSFLAGYKIWRLTPGQELSEIDWILISPLMFDSPNFTDTNWSLVPGGFYKWAVKAIGMNNIMSEPAFSNTLEKPVTITVNVTGTVYGSDAPTVGLQNAIITLTGQSNFSATTDAMGNFIVYSVYANSNYTYTIVHDSYSPATGNITLDSLNYNMGSITLSEIVDPPTNVVALVVQPYVDVMWTNPLYFLGGCKIWRLQPGQEQSEANWTLLTPSLVTTTNFTDYSWSSLPVGQYMWAVKAVYTNNVMSEAAFSNTLEKTVANFDLENSPIVTGLINCAPNPFGTETSIIYTVKDLSPVKIEIYNLKGQKVKSLVNNTKAEGNYQVTWNGTNDNNQKLACGVYFLKLTSGRIQSTRMLVLQ